MTTSKRVVTQTQGASIEEQWEEYDRVTVPEGTYVERLIATPNTGEYLILRRDVPKWRAEVPCPEL